MSSLQMMEEAEQTARLNPRQRRETAITTRVDLLSGSKGSITYANNLEKDPEYKDWPPSVQQLLYPSWQLTTIGKNLYTALLVLDASTDEALNAVYVAHAMLRQGYPVRVAFVLGDASLSDEASGDVFSDEVQDVDEAAGHRTIRSEFHGDPGRRGVFVGEARAGSEDGVGLFS